MTLRVLPPAETCPAYSGWAVTLPSSTVDHAAPRVRASARPIADSPEAKPGFAASWSAWSQSLDVSGGGGGGVGSLTVRCTATETGEPVAPVAVTVTAPSY